MIERQQGKEIITGDSEVKSPYHLGAVDLFTKEVSHLPDSEKLVARLKKLLETVDLQGIDNFVVFESVKYPGVKIPFIKVSLSDLIDEIYPELEIENQAQEVETPEENRQEVYVISSGFAFPPAGHPFTPWDIVYDRAIGLIPAAINAKKAGKKLPEIYVLGSPNSLWGQVTPEWVEALKTEGFAAYGKLAAELLTPLVKTADTETRLVLHGMSLGSAVVNETRKELPDDLQLNTQLLLDNPVLSGNILQVPVGFLLESTLRLLFDPRLKKSMSHEADFYQQSELALKKRGIEPINETAEVSLKRQAAMADVKNLIKTKTFAEGDRTYVRLGLFDPVSFSLMRVIEGLRKYRRYVSHGLAATDKIYPINTSHFIDRYRTKKWAKILGKLT
ncbi:MAG: hypothetical protein IT416_04310 [Candidatus Pacebacteria bacterium]|nr:hypothetical protein [Candidatus Paceibacterota bacterium]